MSISRFKKFLKFFADGIWISFHDHRRLNAFELNSRNAITLAFTGTILVVLLASLGLKVLSTPNFAAFIDDSRETHVLNSNEISYSVLSPQRVNCSKNCSSKGIPDLRGQSRTISSLSDLNDFDIGKGILPTASFDRFWARLDIDITSAAVKSITTHHDHFVISLPQIQYQVASVEVSGEHGGIFAQGQPIRIALPAEYFVRHTKIPIQITYSIQNNGAVYLNRNDQMPPFISTVQEVQRLDRFVSSSWDNSGQLVGTMSRILIAVFALMLFLFIDSAPESLGLALFLGFEAFAIGAGQNWIDLKYNPFLTHYSYQMGDIFRLYFFLQLSRVIKPNPKMWLAIGTLLSIPYGIAKQMEIAWQIDGLYVIPIFRDSTAGSLGALACMRTLWSLRRKRLPLRKTALILGAIGSAQQVLGPVTHFWPQLNEGELFRGFYVAFEALSVYILAMSTFSNISTLENRIKRLSVAKAKSDLIEQELELGRTVQRAFLNIPKLPLDCEVVGSVEATMYVSGDLYFVHWDEIEQRLAVVLSDVTGHGVQASLKATACFMLAKNLWQSKLNPIDSFEARTARSRLDEFHIQTNQMLRLFSETPDIAAFGGVEIFSRRRRMMLYRTNFNVPIIFEPDGAGGWNLTTPQLEVGTVKDFNIAPGTVIAIFSDGFVGSSRQYMELRKFLSMHASDFDGSAAKLKDLISEFNIQNSRRPDDDRSLIVISWKRQEYLAATRITSAKDIEQPRNAG